MCRQQYIGAMSQEEKYKLRRNVCNQKTTADNKKKLSPKEAVQNWAQKNNVEITFSDNPSAEMIMIVLNAGNIPQLVAAELKVCVYLHVHNLKFQV